MAEYFDRYRQFERFDSNRMIDKPILLLWQMTAIELMAGLSLVISSFYVAFVSSLAALATAIGGILLPLYLRKLRGIMPRNTLMHFAWNLGLMDRELPASIKRGRKNVMGP